MAKKQSMKRVAEGIYRRPNGKYVVPVWDPATKTRRYTHPDVPRGGFDRLEDARAFKRKAGGQRRLASIETCDEFAERWPQDFPRPKRSTNVHNTERVKAFAKDFKGVRLQDLSRQQARRWALNHPHHYRTVRAMFSDAQRDGLIDENPFLNLRLPEGSGREDILVLEQQEVDQLARCATQVWDDWGEFVFAPFILVAAYTGIRPGELYALRWSDIDFENDELHVRRQLSAKTGEESAPKNNKVRTITLLPEARAALKLVPAKVDQGQVFETPRGSRFSQRTAHYYWSPVRAAFWNGLSKTRQKDIPKGFDFYELRHFYATYLVTQWGAQAYEIADQMGHVDGGTLAARRYVHPLSRDVRSNLKARIAAQVASPRRAASG